MLQLIEFLEEVEHNNRTVSIGRDQVTRLVSKFGVQVRSIGVWNHATDGSIEIPMANVIEALQSLDNASLSEAVQQLKSPENVIGFLDRSSAAEKLIKSLAKLRLRQFERKVEQFQECTDEAEAQRLRSEISAELFGN